MSVERKSASRSAITVKSRQKKIRIVEKLHVTIRLVERERIIDIYHNAWFAHGGVCTVGDNPDRTTESAKSETKVSV
jgi:hypothetical protein